VLGWLWRVLVGRFSRCDHVWGTIDVGSLSKHPDDVWKSLGAEPYVVGHFHDLRCTKCGDVVRRRLI
jgi:hypothetical protein